MVSATSHLDVSESLDVYWAGRLTTVRRARRHRPLRPRVRLLLHRPDRAADAAVPPIEIVRPVAVPGTERTGRRESDEEPSPAATASETEILRHRDLAALSASERDVVRRLIAAIDPVGEPRLSRRHARSRRGALDPRRTVRAMLRRGGEPLRLEHRARRVRPRRLVLVVDVSGSMQPYADPYLRFAHAAARRRPGTEVFTIGTRLTRVTREIKDRDPSAALPAVAGRRARLERRHPAGRAAARRFSTGGDSAVSPAVRSSSSPPTAGSGARPTCSVARWHACTGWPTAWSGSTRTAGSPAMHR